MAHAYAMVRPVEEYWIEPRRDQIQARLTDDKISLRSVTQFAFPRPRKSPPHPGAQLTRTSLVLQMQGHLQTLKGIVEMGEDLQIVVQENILLRREQDLNALLSVEHGQIIDAKSAVATTQVLTKTSARVQLSKTDERRILLITEEQQSHQKN